MKINHTIKLLGLLLLTLVVLAPVQAVGDKKDAIPCIVKLKNGEDITGDVEIFKSMAKEIVVFPKGAGIGVQKLLQAENIRKIEIFNLSDKSTRRTIEYLKVNTGFSVASGWVAKIAEGAHLAFYVAAEQYDLSTTGALMLVGTQVTTYTNNLPSMSIQPSFPVCMQRPGDEVLKIVGLHHGVQFEDSSLRGGICHYISDDNALCLLIRRNKLGFEDLQAIAEMYIPRRTDEPLLYKGEVVKPREEEFITDYFNGEMEWKVELDNPTDANNQHGTQFRVGIQSSFSKYFTYGGELGFSSAVFVHQDVLPIGFDNEEDPMKPEYYGKAHGLLLNGFMGVQLPMNLKNMYIVPGASMGLGLGVMVADDINNIFAPHYAPTLTLDFGFKTSKGGIWFLGMGRRHVVSLASAESKKEDTYKGFNYYNTYNSIFFRLGFIF